MNRVDPLFKLTERYFSCGKFRECIDLIQIHLKENQNDLDARLLFAKALKNVGQHEDALTQAEAIRQFASLSQKPCVEADELFDELQSLRAAPPEPPEPDQNEVRATEAQDQSGPAAPQPLGPHRMDEDAVRASRRISPFFGYPEQTNGPVTNNYGFVFSKHRGRTDYPYPASPNDFIVGFFGGSIASGFFQDTCQTVESRLAAHPDLAGKNIVALNFSSGAMRQPQQLLFLSYFLTLGQQFDLVINMNGLSETAGAIGNFYHGHHPAMPSAVMTRSLEVLTSIPQLDTTTLNFFAEIAALEKRLKWPFLPSFLKSGIAEKIAKRKQELPSLVQSENLLEIQRVKARNYLESEEVEREKMRQAVLDIWFNAAIQMKHICTANGAAYVEAIHPTYYYTRRQPSAGDAAIIHRGASPHQRVAVQDTWPRMLDLANSLDDESPVFCDLVGALDDVTEDVFLDSMGHFNPRGHTVICDKLCAFLLKLRLAPKNLETGSPR
jgi:hypothetical protein